MDKKENKPDNQFLNNFSIPDHWDTDGEITAESDAQTEYRLWRKTAQGPGWHGREFELADFKLYIAKLQKELKK